MATASKSFTAVGLGTQLFVRHKDSFTYSVSGTFVGTVELKRSVNGGVSYESTGISATAAASGTVLVEVPDGSAAIYLFQCTAFTSGTIVTSLADAVKVIQEFKDEGGNPIFQVREDGVKVFGNFLQGGSSSLVELTQATDVASATATNLETATGNLVDVTGTTTITSIVLGQGHVRFVRFTGALTLTHGASLVLPGAANIVTVAGDFAIFAGYASSVVRCLHYQKSSIAPIGVAATGVAGILSAGTQTITGIKTFETQLIGKGTATNDNAAAGYIGEDLSVSLAVGSAISLTNATAANVISKVLEAGDYTISGAVVYTPAATTTVGQHFAATSLVSATLPTGANGIPNASFEYLGRSSFGSLAPVTPVTAIIPGYRFKTAAQATVYLVAQATFAVDTLTAHGSLNIERRR